MNTDCTDETDYLAYARDLHLWYPFNLWSVNRSLEIKLIPCSDIVHIGFVVVGRGVMHVLEAVEH